MSSPAELRLGLPGFEFADLHEPDGLARLFADFRAWLASTDVPLAARYEAWPGVTSPSCSWRSPGRSRPT